MRKKLFRILFALLIFIILTKTAFANVDANIDGGGGLGQGLIITMSITRWIFLLPMNI
jgi:hypothetical protein